ncbi:hypothetical protein GGI23_004389 [Coemansia sp. RSA 2559]|nr:hypothetical protein GGI23_004389 [Coemansia sp. RSA 2559]KAJ2860890.1 hypothetical protein GGI22_002598 [Coemansia erecta]
MKFAVVSLLVAALSVATTATCKHNRQGRDASSSELPSEVDYSSIASETESVSVAPSPTGSTSAIWQPAVGASWQIVLSRALSDTSVDAEVYDIDLFDNTAATISSLHSAGRKVICYFSAGTYENWRPDQSDFLASDMGNELDGWPGEKWLDVTSANVRTIMQKRLDMAKAKGCDGVDPDNVDGYDNDNGLGLTQSNAIDFVNWLAGEAHSRGMSVGLKNAGGIIASVIDNMQWSVNEQCAQYNECDTYAAFPDKGKPVFHIEYPKGDNTNNSNDVSASQLKKACVFNGSARFSTLIKNMNLDSWFQLCS